MEIQPPPDAPPPPPSEAALLSRKKWYLLKAAGVTSIVLLLLSVLGAPMVIRSRRGTPHSRAVSDLRMLSLALSEFECTYGSFPEEGTIEAVRMATGTDLDLGTTSSNGFFRQLLGTEIAASESTFYAEGKGVRRPDGIIIAGQALQKGECGFTYFLGAKPSDNPKRPLVVAPMIPGTDRFDPEPFEGNAVVLHRDNTVYSYPIDRKGHVIFENRNLMDPHHPVWDGHTPSIAWPDL